MAKNVERDDASRRTGPALEAMYRLMLWLVPTVEGFPRRQKFLLGDRIQSTALDVLERLIEATYTRVHFAGDDLLAPLERRFGLLIGNLTSQFFANVYLDGFDHFVKEILRVKGYLRYVGDFALFDDEPERLVEWRLSIERFLVGRRLLLCILARPY